jgi:hypothetical protein
VREVLCTVQQSRRQSRQPLHCSDRGSAQSVQPKTWINMGRCYIRGTDCVAPFVVLHGSIPVAERPRGYLLGPSNQYMLQTTNPQQTYSVPGGLFSSQSWPFIGAKTERLVGITREGLSRSGFLIDGVQWTFPTSDRNPTHYMVIPTVIHRSPYIVWCHVPPLGKPGSSSISAISCVQRRRSYNEIVHRRDGLRTSYESILHQPRRASC